MGRILTSIPLHPKFEHEKNNFLKVKIGEIMRCTVLQEPMVDSVGLGGI